MDFTFIKFVTIVCSISLLISFILMTFWIYLHKNKNQRDNKINYIQRPSGFTRVVIKNGNIHSVESIISLKEHDLSYITLATQCGSLSIKEFNKILKKLKR